MLDDDHGYDVAREGVGLLSPEQALAQGLHLMTRRDLEAAVGDSVTGGGVGWDDDGGATSREGAVRAGMLARYRDDPDLLWRSHLVADDRTLARLRDLARGAGNMARALDVVRRAAVLSRHAGSPLRVPPLILVGPPGTGKSRIAGLIAGALGTTSRTVAGTSIQDIGPLLGYGPAWRGAGPGAIAKALLACATAAPVLVIDEAEKVALATDGPENPLDCLLPLLEPGTAAAFRDAYLDVPMRAENIVWLFCANGLQGLSRPLLDRCLVIEVPELAGDARHRALEELVADVVLDHGVAPADLDAESLDLLGGIGLRRARAVVGAALAGAIEAGRDWIEAADVRAAVELLGGGTPQPLREPAGFVRF